MVTRVADLPLACEPGTAELTRLARMSWVCGDRTSRVRALTCFFASDCSSRST
jgi:hypothetical protein